MRPLCRCLTALALAAALAPLTRAATLPHLGPDALPAHLDPAVRALFGLVFDELKANRAHIETTKTEVSALRAENDDIRRRLVSLNVTLADERRHALQEQTESRHDECCQPSIMIGEYPDDDKKTDAGQGWRQLQTMSDSGAQCTEANAEERKKAVEYECCDGVGEDCNKQGLTQTCNIGCALVVCTFWRDCRSALADAYGGEGSADQFNKQVAKQCNSAFVREAVYREPDSEQFSLKCLAEDKTIKDCVPECNHTSHRKPLVAQINGDDSTYTCELHRGLYSWVGDPGGFMGRDVRSFVSSVNVGAVGFFATTVGDNHANVNLDLTIEPGALDVSSNLSVPVASPSFSCAAAGEYGMPLTCE